MKDSRHLLSQTGLSENSSMIVKSRATGMEEDGGEQGVRRPGRGEILVQKKLTLCWVALL